MHFCADEAMAIAASIPAVRMFVPRLKAKIQAWRARRAGPRAVDVLSRVAIHCTCHDNCPSCRSIRSEARDIVDTTLDPHHHGDST